MDRLPRRNEPTGESRQTEDRDPSDRGAGAIDVERLADLVYRLAREEARLARARGVHPSR
jgi:hypothetical protein